MVMLCQFDRLLYPRTVGAVSAGSYMVAIYKPCEKIVDGSGNSLDRFKAVGYDLPTSDRLRYEMQGHWSKNPKHGVQFEVESFDEVITPSRDGIIAYLSSGQIKGIGPKIAERIYDSFGDKALEVLDKEPERLLAVSGISKGKLKKICDSYLASRGARDLVAYLVPHGITPNRAVRLYREYGDEAMDIVRHHPYRLCELVGIGFKTADKIAMSLGLDRMSVERAGTYTPQNKRAKNQPRRARELSGDIYIKGIYTLLFLCGYCVISTSFASQSGRMVLRPSQQNTLTLAVSPAGTVTVAASLLILALLRPVWTPPLLYDAT